MIKGRALLWTAALLLWATPAAAGSIWKNAPPLTDVLALAAPRDARIVIKLTARWCAPCRKLEAELLDPSVARHLAMYHRATYDGHSGEGKEIARRFNVVTFPTLLLIDARARELGRVSGYRAAPSLLAELKGIEDGSFSLSAREAALKKNPDDLALRLQLGQAWALRGDRIQADRYLLRILSLASGKEKVPSEQVSMARTLAPRAMLIRGKVLELLSLQDPGAAERTLRALVKAYPRSAEAGRAGLYIAWALLDQGKKKVGLRALGRWARGDAGRELAAARLCLREERAPAAAASHARSAAGLEPDNARAWATLGRALFALERTALAVSAMTRAVELAPEQDGYRLALDLYSRRLKHKTEQRDRKRKRGG